MFCNGPGFLNEELTSLYKAYFSFEKSEKVKIKEVRPPLSYSHNPKKWQYLPEIWKMSNVKKKESSSETHKIIGHPGKANVEWEDGNKLLSFNLKSVALLQSCECLKGCMNE